MQVICCVAACFLLVSCNKNADAPHSLVLNRGLPGDPRSLDPSAGDDVFSQQVLRDLWEGLTDIDADGQVVPGVASDWVTDPAGITYTFRLRPDAKWSDGKEVVAQEFVDGLRHSVDPTVGSGNASLLSVIQNATAITAGTKSVLELGVHAIDAHTLRLELERPAPFVLQILAEPVSAPRRSGLDGLSSSSVTDGPYMVAERRLGSLVRLEANRFYWDFSRLKLKTINYVIADSESSELRQYLANQLDLTYTIPISDLRRLESSHASEIQRAPILGTMYLALNLQSKAIGSDRELRKALSIAIDRDSITKNLTLGATPAYGLVARGISNYSAYEYPWSALPRDQQIALAQSAYMKSGHSAARPLKLVLYYNNNESIKRIMVAVADSWKRNLGVETDLVGEEFRVFLDGRKDRSKWDVARLGWWADYNDASSFLEIFTTTGVQNDPGYSDRDFDQLINEARADADEHARAQLLNKAEARMLEDYAIIPVYFYSAMRLVKPGVVGAQISPLNRTYSRSLSWQTH